jgi:hypothetical protein
MSDDLWVAPCAHEFGTSWVASCAVGGTACTRLCAAQCARVWDFVGGTVCGTVRCNTLLGTWWVVGSWVAPCTRWSHHGRFSGVSGSIAYPAFGATLCSGVCGWWVRGWHRVQWVAPCARVCVQHSVHEFGTLWVAPCALAPCALAPCAAPILLGGTVCGSPHRVREPFDSISHQIALACSVYAASREHPAGN